LPPSSGISLPNPINVHQNPPVPPTASTAPSFSLPTPISAGAIAPAATAAVPDLLLPPPAKTIAPPPPPRQQQQQQLEQLPTAAQQQQQPRLHVPSLELDAADAEENGGGGGNGSGVGEALFPAGKVADLQRRIELVGKEAFIGLEYVIEVQHNTIKKMQNNYTCLLCDAHIKAKNNSSVSTIDLVTSHIKGIPHRIKYIVSQNILPGF